MKIIINKKNALLKGNVPKGQRVFPAFTLIEILVVVGILALLIVSVGGIMGMTFKAKNSSEGNELLSSKAEYVLTELKRNILNADANRINCPVGVGTSISFIAKDGIFTTLSCLDSTTPQIASVSAENGTFNLLNDEITTNDCTNFVKCVTSVDGKVKSVEFNLNLKAPADAAGAGSTGFFYGVAVPRK